MARDKKAAQKQKPAKAAAVNAEPKKSKKAKQGSYDSLRDPLDRCGCSSGLDCWHVCSMAPDACSRNKPKHQRCAFIKQPS
jgi:Pyruvate/2-oxoacid:ferredoxin oxidoreductase delta subunit